MVSEEVSEARKNERLRRADRARIGQMCDILIDLAKNSMIFGQNALRLRTFGQNTLRE